MFQNDRTVEMQALQLKTAIAVFVCHFNFLATQRLKIARDRRIRLRPDLISASVGMYSIISKGRATFESGAS